MFGYMTELETVEESRTDSIEAEGAVGGKENGFVNRFLG